MKCRLRSDRINSNMKSNRKNKQTQSCTFIYVPCVRNDILLNVSTEIHIMSKTESKIIIMCSISRNLSFVKICFVSIEFIYLTISGYLFTTKQSKIKSCLVKGLFKIIIIFRQTLLWPNLFRI